jgi:hypothetical protein
MEEPNRPDILHQRPPATRDLVLLGAWMRASFVGGAFAAAGVASLIDPPQGVPFLTALTWVLAGGAFASRAWQRTAALLDRIDRSNRPPSAPDGVPPTPPVATS